MVAHNWRTHKSRNDNWNLELNGKRDHRVDSPPLKKLHLLFSKAEHMALIIDFIIRAKIFSLFTCVGSINAHFENKYS